MFRGRDVERDGGDEVQGLIEAGDIWLSYSIGNCLCKKPPRSGRDTDCVGLELPTRYKHIFRSVIVSIRMAHVFRRTVSGMAVSCLTLCCDGLKI